MLGWTVLSQLKQDPATRHIPVQIVTMDEDRNHGLARGAFAFLHKPTTPEGIGRAFARIKDYAAPRRKRLLLVEDDEAERKGVSELLASSTSKSCPRTPARPRLRNCAKIRPIAWCWI